jgi:GntR family transcriptional regulator/MocR family aminotransferase
MAETWAISEESGGPPGAGDLGSPGGRAARASAAEGSGRASAAGLDLHLDLTGSRVRASLEAALRDAVRGGRLLPGTRLPSSRALAADLGIARNTVAEAYGQLVAEGWLAAGQGSGTWVAERAGTVPAAPAIPAAARARRVRYDLRTGVPDVSAFPRSGWLAAARKALLAAPSEALSYGDPRGLPELRTALAGYLARSRGLVVTPERVVVCAGFAQGLELVCESLRAGGAETLAVEEYGYERHWRIARDQGLALRALEVDAGGAVLGEWGRAAGSGLALRGAQAVLLTPTHQFPFGVSLEPARRRQAADWAAATGGLIIEDDYDGELRYDRPAVGALQALAPERVVYIGTASKSLMPGLRLGWLVLPSHLADQVAEAKGAVGRFSSSLDQLTLAEFIGSGAYDRQVRRARLAYRRRRDRLVAAVRRDAPRVRVTGIAAGLHALLRLPPGHNEQDLVARAARHGVAVEGLGEYAMGSHHAGPALVVGYATPPAHAYSTAVARLCAVLAGRD